MNQYRFDINDRDSEYNGPPCPRVVKCKECKRIMEAPLLGKAKECCLAALRGALSKWLEEEYAEYMSPPPSPLDIAMAQVSLDALMYDMKHGFTEDYIVKHPEVLDDRDKFMNKKLIKWLRRNGFETRINKNGTIDAKEIDDLWDEEHPGFDSGYYDWT